MYLPIPAATFHSILNLARQVIRTQSTLPCLTCVHLAVQESLPRLLTVIATDLDITLVKHYALPEPAVPGTLLLPLADLARILPDKGTLVIIHQRTKHDVSITAITSGAPTVHHLQTLDTKEFPDAIPPPDPATVSTTWLPAESLAALAAARAFHSTDETRYVLNGCLLEPSAVVATDGRRACMFLCPGPPVSIILPTKACEILFKTRASNAILTLPLAKPESATFAWDGITLHTKLIAGNYPNWRQVIPPASARQLTFADPAPVIKFLRRLDPKGIGGAVTLTPLAECRLELSHKDATLITPAVFSKDTGPSAFNPAFLADCLENVGHTFNQEDERSPALFSTPNALAVLMPMRLATAEPIPVVTAAEVPAAA